MSMRAAGKAASLNTDLSKEECVMAFNPQRHRRWLLASRPHGEPTGENFRLEEGEVASPGPGQLLLRTVFLSLDP